MNDCECTNRTHNVTLSIAKALCIILMVIGHSGCPAYLHDWIYLFHMPCFFLISGYLLNDRNIENLGYGIKKRFKNLWYPYVKWSILFLLLHNVFYSWGFYLNKYSMNEIAIHAGKTLFFYGSEQLLWPYWFLSASLIASIIGLFYLKFFHSSLHLTHISITGGGNVCVNSNIYKSHTNKHSHVWLCPVVSSLFLFNRILLQTYSCIKNSILCCSSIMHHSCFYSNSSCC